MTKKTLFIAFVVSLGGFLFGFDAGVISGVMEKVTPEFELKELQEGWVTSSPTFAAMISMLIAGRLSDLIGRKKILLSVAFLYAFSAITSAYAFSYETLYISRMVGGLAFGAALILAPTYIAEISTAENRGKLVSIQQLNIVLGFFAAFLSNYYFNHFNDSGSDILNDENVWRWMLGVEFFPAIFYFGLLFFVPESPRWLYTQNRIDQAKLVLERIHGIEQAEVEIHSIEKNIEESEVSKSVSIRELFAPALRFIMLVGITLGILQQVTGINAILFYATSIFKQTGIGTDAAFSQGVVLSFTQVVFTLLAIYLIDRMGRRPLLLFGMSGIAISLLLCAYSFNQATYEISADEIDSFESSLSETYANVYLDAKNPDGTTKPDFKEKVAKASEIIKGKLSQFQDKTYHSDVAFKNDIKAAIGNQVYEKNEGDILEAAINIDATLVLIGILVFIACFAFSLGPVMWVMLSEIFPNRYRGLAIGVIGFINSFSSWVIQLIFPWEISNLGSALTFFIYGLIATIGVLLFIKILPETKGKSLEQLENELVKSNN